MNGGHRRHSGQHRLGWLPLLCLQGIFQLLPEALGHPSHLLYQNQHHLQHHPLKALHPNLAALRLPHQPHLRLLEHHLDQLSQPTIHLLPQHDLHGYNQHLLSHQAYHLHKQLTIHLHRLHLLPHPVFAPKHHFRVCQHRLALRRAMRPSSRHHHHNDLMTTTTPSELKFQGIVSSQTQRQAELTSRSSQGLMQWPSVVEHLVSSIFGSKQPPLAGRSIEYMHLCESAESTSSPKRKESSKPCVDILEVDDYISEETSVDSHQEGRSSLTMIIRPQRRVESHPRAEEHQSVIVLDYIFLTNPHHVHQRASEEGRHDIARTVSSNIKQQEPSSGDPSHPRIISLGIIVDHISALLVTRGGHLALVFTISIAIILPHLHQVWPIHAVHLQAFHLCLHLLCVHLFASIST